MAIVQFGSFITEMRGKVGDLVYSRNRGGNYVKSLGTYTDPDTVPQQLIRSYMADANTYWQILSEAQKISWFYAITPTPKFKNHYKDKIHLGYCYFISCFITFKLFGGVTAVNYCKNSTFDDSSYWSLSGANINISSGKLNFISPGSYGFAYSVVLNYPIPANFELSVELDISNYASGTVRFYLDSGPFVYFSADGHFSFTYSRSSPSTYIYLQGVSSFIGSLDNFYLWHYTDIFPKTSILIPCYNFALTIDSSPETVSLSFSPANIPANHGLLIYATDGMSTGINHVNLPFKLISQPYSGNASPLNLLSAYKAVFTSIPAAGKKVFFKIVTVNLQSYQRSVSTYVSTIVLS